MLVSLSAIVHLGLRIVGDISTWHLTQDEYGMYGIYLNGKPSAEQFHNGCGHAPDVGRTTKILPPQWVLDWRVSKNYFLQAEWWGPWQGIKKSRLTCHQWPGVCVCVCEWLKVKWCRTQVQNPISVFQIKTKSEEFNSESEARGKEPCACWLKYFNRNYYCNWDGLKIQMNSVENTMLAKLFQNTEHALADIKRYFSYFQ
jgi:hypothetical protein